MMASTIVARIPRLVFTLVCWSCIAFVARAQERYPDKEVAPRVYAEPPPLRRLWKGPRLYGGTAALFGTPFEGVRAGGGWGYGMGFTAAVGYNDWPVLLGMDVAFAFYGIQRGSARGEYEGQTYTQHIRRRERAVFLDLFLRVMPTTWKVRPYGEGVIGGKTISGQYRVSLPNGNDDSSDDADQTTYSVGAGAGFDFTLRDRGPSRTYVTVGYRYLHGGKIAFDKNVSNDGGDYTTRKGQFATDTHQFTLGLAFDYDLWAHVDE